MTAVDLPRIPRTVPDWHERGACQLFPELDWIDATGAAKLACRIVCAACPVRFVCARDALERGEPWGMWGGLDRQDRRAVALEFGYPPPAVLPEHGTNSRYAKHKCHCPECRAAHTIYESQRREARRRESWTPVVLEMRTRIGGRWVPAGQLMLPLHLPHKRQTTTVRRQHLALVA